jgi:hypothetical protein
MQIAFNQRQLIGDCMAKKAPAKKAPAKKPAKKMGKKK